MNRHLLSSRVAAAVTACAAATGLAGTAAPTASAARPVQTADAAIAAAARPVLLLNGDRVAAPVPGRAFSELLPAPRGGIVLSVRLGRRTELIPAAALPYLGRGLAPSLFDLASLRHAEFRGRLPVQITFTGQRPRLPGVTLTRLGRGQAQGYLTTASARVFGAALIGQYRADKARASYGQDGMFAGGVIITLPGASSPARPRPQFPMHTVTVTGTSLDGRPDTGDTVLVVNAADANTFGDPVETLNVFDHGTARFSVPAGTYWAVADFAALTRTSSTQRLVVIPQFAVHASTRIRLSARAATSELGASTPRPSALQAAAFELLRTSPHDTLSTASAVATFVSSPADHLWINPTAARPSVGSLHVYDTQTLTSPPHAARTPYVYNLAVAGPAGTIPDLHPVISQRSLATVTEHFYQAVTSTGTTATLADYTKMFLGIAVPVPVHLPGQQTEYMSGNPAVAYQTSAPAQDDTRRQVRAGQRLTEVWNNYPLHPQPFAQLLRGRVARAIPEQPSAFRMGDKLVLFPVAFSDNTYGHTGAGFWGPHGAAGTGSYAVYENGVKVAHGRPLPVNGVPFVGLPPVRLSHKPSVIRFVLSGARHRSYALSPAFRTMWTWRSAPRPGAELPRSWFCTLISRRCAVQPMMTLAYDVHGMSPHGTTAPGRQQIRLTVSHLQLSGHATVNDATAQFSVDGGRTWQATMVTRTGGGTFTISFTAPAGNAVTLRTHATDTAGGSITETIHDAYRVRPQPGITARRLEHPGRHADRLNSPKTGAEPW